MDELDRELDALYEDDTERKGRTDVKANAKQDRQKVDDEDWSGLAPEPGRWTDDSSQDDMDYEDMKDEVVHRQSLPNLVRDSGLTRRASSFFDRSVFGDIAELKEESTTKNAQATSRTVSSSTPQNGTDQTTKGEQSKRQTETITVLKNSQHVACNELIDSEHTDKATDTNAPDERTDSSANAFSSHKGNKPTDIDIITVEAMTLAQQLASGDKRKESLIDDGYNRYSFPDTTASLPGWFVDDEETHTKPNKPMTAAAAAAIKEKLRALNARPIGKVREARDRKMMRVRRRVEILQKGYAASLEDGGRDGDGVMSGERTRRMAAKLTAAKKRPRRQVRLVVAKGGNKGIQGRPRGVKGRYRIVDARLKKDLRGLKKAGKRK